MVRSFLITLALGALPWRSGAWRKSRAAPSGKGGRTTRPSFFFILGIEGTGHHFWQELGGRLHERATSAHSATQVLMMDEVAAEVTRCVFMLSHPRAPRVCGGCAADRSCPLTAAAASGKWWPVRAALGVNGCSYPCGARNPDKNDAFRATSPDFPRFVRELAGGGATPKPVVMVRDPGDAANSAHFRRHGDEQHFETTAFELYMALGLLDRHVRRIEALGYECLVVNYEDLVDGENLENATTRVAAFLDYSAPALHIALRGKRTTAPQGRPKEASSAAQRRYADYLFLLAEAAPDWYPRLWSDYGRYVAPAAARADPDTAARRRSRRRA